MRPAARTRAGDDVGEAVAIDITHPDKDASDKPWVEGKEFGDNIEGAAVEHTDARSAAWARGRGP